MIEGLIGRVLFFFNAASDIVAPRSDSEVYLLAFEKIRYENNKEHGLIKKLPLN